MPWQITSQLYFDTLRLLLVLFPLMTWQYIWKGLVYNHKLAAIAHLQTRVQMAAFHRLTH